MMEKMKNMIGKGKGEKKKKTLRGSVKPHMVVIVSSFHLVVSSRRFITHFKNSKKPHTLKHKHKNNTHTYDGKDEKYDERRKG